MAARFGSAPLGRALGRLVGRGGAGEGPAGAPARLPLRAPAGAGGRPRGLPPRPVGHRALHGGGPGSEVAAAGLGGAGLRGLQRGGRGLSASAAASAEGLPPYQALPMPSLSPTMTEGNLAEWKKAEGDPIAAGDVLAEIETDKASMDWEAVEDGYLAKILVPSGAQAVPVGQLVAVMVEEEEELAAFKNLSADDFAAGAESAAAAAPAAAAPAAEEPAAAPAADYPPHQVLGMPSLSPTMTMGNLLAWSKAAGDEVAAGDILCEIETDKSTMEWEAVEDGVVAKILVPEGTSDIEVGTPVLVIAEEAEDVPAFADFTAAAAAPAAPAPTTTSAPPPPPPPPAAAATAPVIPGTPVPSPAAASETVFASPYARKLAGERGLDLAAVKGTGPGGRVIAADVEEYVPGAAEAPAAAFVDIPHSQIRRVTAARLLESKQTIPHYYLSMDCEVDALMRMRKELNAATEAAGGPRLSVNDFVVKAAALACKAVPEVNASWSDDFIRQFRSVDVSIAVQTEQGLMVPVVRSAELKGVGEISGEVKALAAKAKAGQLTPAEFSGGTFTISNLGMYGIKQFCAIVNPPQACILAVGGAQRQAVMDADTGAPKEVQVMTVTLSCDHRVVDGAVGAQWLQAFKGFIEAPLTQLL